MSWEHKGYFLGKVDYHNGYLEGQERQRIFEPADKNETALAPL